MQARRIDIPSHVGIDHRIPTFIFPVPYIVFLHLYARASTTRIRESRNSLTMSPGLHILNTNYVCVRVGCVCVPAAGVTIVFAFARERHMRPVVARTHTHAYTHTRARVVTVDQHSHAIPGLRGESSLLK